MLNASEHAAAVILSGKMKCLHSRLSERARERKREREKIRGRERRVAILQKGVNHLISTAPPHSPQNGYFVPSDGQRQEGGAIWTTTISSPTSVTYSSTSTISHIYGQVSYNTLLSGFLPAHFLPNEICWIISYFLKAQFNVLVNIICLSGCRARFFMCTAACMYCIMNNAIKWTKRVQSMLVCCRLQTQRKSNVEGNHTKLAGYSSFHNIMKCFRPAYNNINVGKQQCR